MRRLLAFVCLVYPRAILFASLSSRVRCRGRTALRAKAKAKGRTGKMTRSSDDAARTEATAGFLVNVFSWDR